MQLAESISFWIAVVVYAASFGAFAVALIFRKPGMDRRAVTLSYVGYTVHTMSLALRWLQTGYPPFVLFFESVSAAAWFGVVGFLILQALKPGLRLSGLGVMGVVFLLLGWASTPSYAGEALSVSLQSIWLYIHATFATAGTGCFIVAAGISFLWLWKRRRNGPLTAQFNLPSPESIDESASRLITIGFLFYTAMLLSGSIWANQAWGRYWGWDPIETWSLITWLMYAVFLHLHFTFKKLRGAFTAWYAIIAMVFAAFSLWGVSYVYSTIHTYG